MNAVITNAHHSYPMITNPNDSLILIVEDDVDYANTVSVILYSKGYQPAVATTGWEAIEKIKEQPPAVLLLDLKLPDTDGIKLLPRLKALVPDTEVIILTGYATVDTAVQALHLGAFAYLQKPCTSERLFLTIENALIHRRYRLFPPAMVFGKLLLNSSLPVIGFNPESGTVLFTNQAFNQLFNIPPDEQLLPRVIHLFFPGNENKIVQHLRRLRSENTAVTELLISDPSGTSRCYLLFSFLSSAEAIFSVPNTQPTATAILVDITQHHNEKLAYRRTAEYLQAIWKNIAAGVAIIDNHFTFQEVNPHFARFYQTTPAALTGKKCYKIVHNFNQPCRYYGENCPIFNSLVSGTVSRVEHHHRDPEGKIHFIETKVAPLHDENGTVVAFIAIYSDLTDITVAYEQLNQQTEELKKANMELLRLSAAKDEFIATVSHELRTPLTTIVEIINLFNDGSLGPLSEKQKHFLKAARRNSSRLTKIINDLLDLAKIQSQSFPIQPAIFNISQVINELAEAFTSSIQEKKISLTVSLPSQPLLVYADEEHIRRVLFNLLSNAIKFTDHGWVRLTAAVEDGVALVTVADSGVGIPESEQPHIFEKFHQAHSQVGSRPPGTGLGLAISRELILLNRGKIWFKSVPDQGTSFFFTVPLFSPNASQTQNLQGETNG